MTYRQGQREDPRPAAREIDLLNRALELRAGAGEWSEVGELMARRDGLLSVLDEADKAEAFEKTLRANENLLFHASADRAQAAERLDAFRQRRTLDAFYKRNSGA